MRIVSSRLILLLTATRIVQGLGFTPFRFVTTTSVGVAHHSTSSHDQHNLNLNQLSKTKSRSVQMFIMSTGSETNIQTVNYETRSLQRQTNDIRPAQEEHVYHQSKSSNMNLFTILASLTAVVLPMVTMAVPAHAASGGVVQNALVAYVHYASILVCVAAVMAQRCMVQANMSTEQEDDLFTSEIVLGIASVALLVSGFFRIDLDKGLDFYSHEPWFWIKIILAGVWGGASMFPSTIIFNRYLERTFTKKNCPQPPISTKLAARMNQVLNAELTALLCIPLTATLMARGVGYAAEFPWQVGVALSIISWVGLSYKYGKDAVAWSDDDPVESIESVVSSSSNTPELSKK